MKNFNDLKIRLSSILVLLAIIGLNNNSFAQWQTSGSNIYYEEGIIGCGINPSSSNYPTTLLISRINNNASSVYLHTGNLQLGSGSAFNLDFPSNIGGRFHIDTMGLVGINTTTPQEKLDIKNGNLLIEGSNYGLILTSPDGQKWKITVDNSGNLSAVVTTTKVLEIENEDDISIFPNPTKNKVTIDLKANEIQNISTELYDISGKLVYMKSYMSNSITLDLSGFKSGLYILKIKNSNGEIIKTEKIMKE